MWTNCGFSLSGMAAMWMLAASSLIAGESASPMRGGTGFEPIRPPAAELSEEELSLWFRPIREISAAITEPPDGPLPPDYSRHLFIAAQQDALRAPPPPLIFTWVPLGLCHWPVYWDDIPLERYGQTAAPHLQPAISAVRFYGTFVFMPLLLVIDCPRECVCSLGQTRPGTCAPCQRDIKTPIELFLPPWK